MGQSIHEERRHKKEEREERWEIMIMTLHQDQPAWILKSTQGHNVQDQDKTKCQSK